MNKIHSCTEARPAAAAPFCPSLSPSGFRGACGTGGMAGGLTPESLASSQHGGSHRLTHLHLLPETAAWWLWYVTAVPLRREPPLHPPASPTPGWRTGAQTAPEFTLGSTCTSAAATAPAPTHRPRTQTAVVARGGTPVPALLALGKGRQGPGVTAHRVCHCSQEWAERGTRHTQPMASPAPRWHIPAWNPHCLAEPRGVTRTQCPRASPQPGGCSGGSLPCPLHPVPATPILPPAQSPPACAGGREGAAPHKMDGWN